MFTARDIRALEAAVDLYQTHMEGFSEEPNTERFHADLSDLLNRAKSFKAAKKIAVTDVQINAIYQQFEDCQSMIGGGDPECDEIWSRRIATVNRMFKKNNLPLVG